MTSVITPRGDSVRAPRLALRGRTLSIDGTLVMGVVNASPESFSDAGRFTSVEQRLELAGSLIEAGADIVDVGGQSAITNQPELDWEEEVDRVVPIAEWLASEYPEILVSIDTYRPQVANAALSGGVAIVNDVSGLLYPELVGLCIEYDAALVVTHTRARPKTRLQDPDLYGSAADSVVLDVVNFLADRMDRALAAGLSKEALILDPGPDFTKTPHQTVAMLRRLGAVHALGRPVLLALSRKDFLGAITEKPPLGRDAATHAALAHLAVTPGTIVRVHDVAAAKDVIRTVEVLSGRRDIDPDYLLPDAIRHQPSEH